MLEKKNYSWKLQQAVFHIFLDANFVLIHNHQLALGVNEKYWEWNQTMHKKSVQLNIAGAMMQIKLKNLSWTDIAAMVNIEMLLIAIGHSKIIFNCTTSP